MASASKAPTGLYLVAGSVLLVDQVSKFWAEQALSDGREVTVLPGLLHLDLVHNRGAAFGILPAASFLLIVLSVAVCVAVLVAYRRSPQKPRLMSLALSLTFGGALGNLLDRLCRGRVVDFLDLDTSVDWIRRWPVFNFADVALTFGALLLVITLLSGSSGRNEDSAPSEGEPTLS